jgi:carbamoyltransferase
MLLRGLSRPGPFTFGLRGLFDTEISCMYTLGVHGGINTARRFSLATPPNWVHDASAVLCRDGKVVAASEEERFVRIKHVTHFPAEAIRFCLASEGISLADVSRIVLSSHHMNDFAAMVNKWRYGGRGDLVSNDFREISAEILQAELGVDMRGKIGFVGHHLGHTVSAVAQSGFEDCLSVVLDGWGDGLIGHVASLNGGRLEVIRQFDGLGPAGLYLAGTQWIGFSQFDEYKVMGLAPYGNPAVYERAMNELLTLQADGGFTYTMACIPQDAFRAVSAPLEQRHMDYAAALQQTTERVLLHVIERFQKITGHRNLCLSGGLAQNCTANGKVLTSGLFENVFVQPAAYDAGCSIGAAILGYVECGGSLKSERISHVYWGYETPDSDRLKPELATWADVIDVATPADAPAAAAALIAGGRVIGWTQGKAEFGARALGNRSILADPRPPENKDRINAMVKKRESFRPFAPSVLEEHLHEYFEVPANVSSLPFMVFVVKVKPQYRGLLGAITHVDGSARVQSVSRKANEKYWRVIDEFRKLTGVPMVLNTSFNNDAEPIVNTPNDAINCFLSTQIDSLIIGDFLIHRRPDAPQPGLVRRLIPRLGHRFALTQQGSLSGRIDRVVYDRYRNETLDISTAAQSAILEAAEKRVPFDAVLGPGEDPRLNAELFDLWGRRVFFCDGGRKA